ncbi:uncharacterized protein LOC127734543 [Mytilus californianus]|uniref:uncharacterized protein LOC127734543 n=1 Tax=Mytilus californianus TaxID=6549 RepID=UPI002245B7D0|nr:uncharacterized protein LOC127734543 [Mytilus californianus]
MDLTQEIEALNGEIRIMMKKQEDLRHDIKNDNRKRDIKQMEQQLKNIEKGVDSLTTHCDNNSTRLSEIKEMVLTLSQGVTGLTETVHNLKESSFGRTVASGKILEAIKNDVENVSVSSTVCKNTDCLITEGCISSTVSVTSRSSNDLGKYTPHETYTTDESHEYIRHIERNPSKDDNLEVDTPSEKRAIQDDSISVSDTKETNCQNDTLEVNDRKLRQESKDVAIKNSKAKTCRNDLGYKSLSTERLYDNRVSFHSKWSCFTGTDCSPVFKFGFNTDVPFETNIKQQQPKSHDTRPKLKARRKRLSGNRKQRNTSFQNVDSADKDDSITGMDTTGQPNTTPDWLNYYHLVCEHANCRLQTGTVRRSSGRYVTLVLDISERMKGHNFEIMKKAAVEYIEGVKQVSQTIGMEENIGLAVFGGQNQLIHECTVDLDLILKSIGKLQPSGSAPTIGGLLMGMAGVSTGPFGEIGEFPLQGHIIIFTDGESEGKTSSFSKANSGIDLNSLLNSGGLGLSISSTGISMESLLDENDICDYAGIESVIHQTVSSQTKVFYVPIGNNQKNAILERVIRETNGKMIQTSEMYRLVRMTQVILLATNIASDIMYSADQSREFINKKIKERSSFDDRYNDCLDMVQEFINPLSMEKKRGNFTELTCRSLQLGDRVRRGPDWSHGNQDGHMAGTVVGQQSHGVIRVKWDSGDTNIYMQCDETNTYDLRKVDEPRILVDEMIAVGCRVVRGHNWKFGDTDGGHGSVGTVINVKQEGKVVVRWDSKRTGLYKMGYNGQFEIRVHDAALRSKRPEPRSDYNSPHTSDSESENETCRPKSSTIKDNKTQDPTDYVIPIYSDSTVSAIWEYQEGSEWKKYPNDINVRIEKAYQRKQTGKTIIEMDRTTYQIHFSRMIQVNPSNKTEKSIQRKD